MQEWAPKENLYLEAPALIIYDRQSLV